MSAALHGFAESMTEAGRLAGELGIACREVSVHRFPDGESLVTVEPGGEVAILFRSLDDPNAKLVELLLAAAALRDNGAARVVLVAPYLGYMRQDMAFAPGQAVSQRVIGKLLAAHFDGLLTVDPHLHRVHSMAEVTPGIDAVATTAGPAISAAIDAAANPVLVGPDGESRQWVEAIARPLGLDVIVGTKQRSGDRDVAITFAEIGKVAGRAVVLVDDVIASGVTLETAARQLGAAGAVSIEAMATHCVASEADLEGLRASGIARVRATDSVPGPTAVIPLAGLLAGAIRTHGWLEKG